MIPRTICMLGSGVGSMMHIHDCPFHVQHPHPPSLQVSYLAEVALFIYAGITDARNYEQLQRIFSITFLC